MTTAPPKIAIVFGMLSYRPSAPAIKQFAQAVAPHKVLVHHDFSQTPDLPLDHDNVHVMSDPERTTWGSWSLVSATFKLIEQALSMGEWDYFQLASESCLPARTVVEFENYLARQRPDVMIDLQPLRGEKPVALMNYGWRYLPRSPRLSRLARRAGLWWIGKTYVVQTVCGGHIKVPDAKAPTPAGRAARWFGSAVSRAFLSRRAGAFPMGEFKECWVGSQWFGLSRAAAERLIVQRASASALEAHFKRCHIPDESFIQTLVAHSGFSNISQSNHITFWDAGKNGPDELTLVDLARVTESGRFFARKFSLDPHCPVRRDMLTRLLGRPETVGTDAQCGVADA